MIDELKIIGQLGIGGLAVYFFYRVINLLVKMQQNHLEHIQKGVESLKETATGHGEKLQSIDGGIKDLVNMKREQLNK